ncbi:MAG: tripartite tricarboxylate transporter permease [Hyphomicrobiaceae bacterium]
MEGIVENIGPAIGIVLQVESLSVIALGVLAGVILGVLPGFGGSQALALMFPFTFIMSPEGAILFMVSVYSAAEYGGSIPAILIRTPGTTAAAMTVLDGYPMARNGDAYRALMISITSGVFGGIVSSLIFIVAATGLAWVGLQFGPSEMFALGLLGLAIIGSFVGSNPTKGFIAAGLGLLLSTVGESPFGTVRFAFDLPYLSDGIPLIVMIIAMLAAPEIIRLMGLTKASEAETVGLSKDFLSGKGSGYRLADFIKLLPTMVRGSLIGTAIGAIPGPGPTVGTVIAYNEEKRWSKNADSFGTGVDEAIAAPESANNAVVAGAMVPALALGIPGSGAIAVLLGVLVSKNMVPGPTLFTENGPLVMSVFIGLIVCNMFLLLCGIVGIKYFAKIVEVPGRILGPFVMVMLIIGAYAYDNNLAHAGMVIVLGALAYWMDKFNFSTIPVILGFVMGPIIEQNLNRAMVINQGDIFALVGRPLTLLILSLAFLTAFAAYRRSKNY